MNPGFILVLSILMQLVFTGILKQYFPGFVHSSLYPYIQVPLSSILSIFLPSYLYLKNENKKYLTDFWEETRPDISMIVAFFIGLCLQFIGIAANTPLNMLIEKLNGHVSSAIPTATSSVSFVFSVVCFALIPAVFEEVMFRGIIFNYYRQYGNKAAILISAILFSIMHFSLSNLAGTFILGIVFGIIFMLTNRIIYTVIAHFALNFSACLITYFYNFPIIFSFYKDYQPVFIAVSIPLLFLLIQYLNKSVSKKNYTDEDKFNRTREYMLNIDEENSLKIYEHDIRQNNTALAFKHLVLSPYFYILAVIFIYLGGSTLW